MDPNEVVKRWWDDLWGGDLSVVDDLVAEPYVRHTMDGTKTQSRDQFKADMLQYFRVHNKPRVSIDDVGEGADTVWARIRSEGINLETEGTSRITWIQIHRLNDMGQIAETWTMYSRNAEGW